MTRPVVLDCDPGIDDAVALLLAVASPEIDLRAVTTVAGNASIEHTTRNALRLLELAGRPDIPVGRGASRPLIRAVRSAEHVHGSEGLGGVHLPEPRTRPRGHAVDLVAEVVASSIFPTTIVAVGPLTNIALFLAGHEDLTDRIDRIVVMGGAVNGGNVTPVAEYNVFADPEAAQRVFDSGVPVTMCGLDVTQQANMRPSDTERLRHAGPVGAAVARMLDFYRAFHEQQYGSSDVHVHDALAVAEAVRPGIVTTRRLHVRVDCQSELSRGNTIVDRRGTGSGEPNVDVALDLDEVEFRSLLLERLGAA